MQILTHKICLFKIFIVPLHKKMTATSFPLCFSNAVIAQLVEHWLPKPRVAGSSPVCRSTNNQGVTFICNTFFYV